MKDRINKVLTLAFLVFVSIILHESCAKHYQPDYIIYYNITNETDSQIRVYYSIRFTHNAAPVIDSIAEITPGGYQTLLVSLHLRTNNFQGYPETMDTIYRITGIEIFKDDTIKSTKNYRLTKYWDYSELDDDRAVYNLEVKPGDF